MNILGSKEKLVCPECGQDDLGFRIDGHQLYSVSSAGIVSWDDHDPENVAFGKDAYCFCSACEASGELRRFIGLIAGDDAVKQKTS